MLIASCNDTSKNFRMSGIVYIPPSKKRNTLIFYLSRVVPKFSSFVKEKYHGMVISYVLYVYFCTSTPTEDFCNHAIIHDTERNICNLEKFLFFRCWLDINLIYDVQHLTSFRRIFWHSFWFCLCETASYLHRTVTWEKFVYIF